jgi:hypothetical protein
MIEDMTVRGFRQETRRDYLRHVRAFAAFVGRSPDTATAEDLYGRTVSRRARSGRSSVTVKKKRTAETALLMLGGCMPLCV